MFLLMEVMPVYARKVRHTQQYGSLPPIFPHLPPHAPGRDCRTSESSLTLLVYESSVRLGRIALVMLVEF